MQTYRYVTPRKVLSGVGSLESLRSEVEAAGDRHDYVLTARSLQTSASLRRVERVLGELRAGTFPASRQHTPQASVEQATAGARACGADLIVAFGGGSVIDTAKVVALRLGENDCPLRARAGRVCSTCPKKLQKPGVRLAPIGGYDAASLRAEPGRNDLWPW